MLSLSDVLHFLFVTNLCCIMYNNNIKVRFYVSLQLMITAIGKIHYNHGFFIQTSQPDEIQDLQDPHHLCSLSTPNKMKKRNKSLLVFELQTAVHIIFKYNYK